ncbi:hypothetical protein P691DRAFT_726450 [Macrolepiota fuliginosa MF-IS2]|uniref:Carbohydrate-binding module family 19 domain-containing protein n=1 Tax=Macrolepiota fuliginosa MF-IS2 TaxID=1400762 RepID=A0A9P5XF25_9AGAR|nr:hypothetical protein P691DRAFT_726450 [Macrolepiota fuliginosa MF-IS2]
MRNNLLIFFLSFAVAVYAAPTSLDAATLLQNGQEAQTQNGVFRNLKASDPCEDGQVACIGKSIAKCQGTTWETNRGQCSRSQSCFVLPSVSRNGTAITCTSQKSALNLISATGATGGIFGNSSNSTSSTSGIDNGGAIQPSSGASSASYIMRSTSTAPLQVFTTVITLFPSQITTLPSVTRTMSPEDASSLVSSINAAAKPTVTASSPASYMPPSPTSSSPTLSAAGDANPSASASSPVTTVQAQGNYGGYGGY